jgi:xylan 1,4-beta-xylosidase
MRPYLPVPSPGPASRGDPLLRGEGRNHQERQPSPSGRGGIPHAGWVRVAGFFTSLANVAGLALLAAKLPTLAVQQRVLIRVDARATQGPFRSAWSYFGYDEPNYTYTPNGRKLLGELSRLTASPVYIRTHNLLTTGDGTGGLKWGSTNVYSEDATGRPVYDWTILDRVFDAYRDAGVKPLVEIGFMPEALSTRPEPYRHSWPAGTLWTGWAYPPRDYQRWADLVYQFAHHLVERYGRKEAGSWYWEVWNEPNIGYWQSTPEEYYKLYDFATDAVKRALPEARVGGPHSTGPANPEAAAFLRNFLQHCVRGRNYATGQTGVPLDYIGFHAKGSPRLVDGHVQMGISRHLQDVSKGFETVASFPELHHLPVILGESDPEGCAACSAQTHPENAYRNGPAYAGYIAAVQNRIFELADRYKINLAGVVTWAFEFENQPYFAGFRSLATNGVDKPVLNVFRMMGLMRGELLRSESSGGLSLDSIVQAGARGNPDINAMAASQNREVDILVWNYHDDDVSAPAAEVELVVNGIPGDAQRVLMQHYRVDDDWSNSYSVWKQMGSPQSPSSAQYTSLETAGHLQLLTSPEWLMIHENGALTLDFTLPRYGVSCIRLIW